MGREKILWGIMRVYLLNGEETESLIITEMDFIKNCSFEIKTIIAFYSKSIINLLDPGQNIELANALGNFQSLEEARRILLQNKEQTFRDIEKREYFFRYLKIEIQGNIVLVTIPMEKGIGEEIDEFIIQKNGNIKFVKKTVKK